MCSTTHMTFNFGLLVFNNSPLSCTLKDTSKMKTYVISLVGLIFSCAQEIYYIQIFYILNLNHLYDTGNQQVLKQKQVYF